MKRRILLVDDEVAVLLTLKAVLEISGFDVDTAASAREAKLKLRSNQYHMVITDMRMESDQAGADVIQAARIATYQPAVALLTAFPLAEEDWQEMGADQMLIKPMHTRLLLQQIDVLLAAHENDLGQEPSPLEVTKSKVTRLTKKPAKKVRTAALKKVTKKSPRKITAIRKPIAKSVAKKTRKRQSRSS